MSECNPCGASPCQPANVAFQNTCVDPGVLNIGVGLWVLDSQFCPRRLNNSTGLLVQNSTPSGVSIVFSNEPQVALTPLAAISGGTVGSLVVEDSNQVLRYLSLPNTSGLYLSTNGSGQLALGPLPTFSVPDPLTVTTINVTSLVATNATISGSLILSGIGTGAIAYTLGVDAGGNVIKGSPSTTGIAAAMFFESPTSPSAATPNGNAVAGSILVIGNQLYDSGGSIITVTNSQTLTVAVAGKYRLDFEGQITWSGGASGAPAINLLINGVLVNTGNARPSGAITSTLRNANLSGFEFRELKAGDTIQLQLAASSGVSTHVYEVRLGAQKFA